jgi:hypothetical protein
MGGGISNGSNNNGGGMPAASAPVRQERMDAPRPPNRTTAPDGTCSREERSPINKRNERVKIKCVDAAKHQRTFRLFDGVQFKL